VPKTLHRMRHDQMKMVETLLPLNVLRRKAAVDQGSRDYDDRGVRLAKVRVLVRLTRVSWRRSVTERAMKIAAPMNIHRWGAAVSLVTLLALIVAPICAPLCAAQACFQAPGAAAKAPCHFAETTKGDGLYARAAQICGALELQAAYLTSTNLRTSLRAQRLRISADSFDLLSPDLLPRMENHRGAGCAHTPPPEHPSSPFTTVVLRI